jgi:hypothetical protein
MEVVMKKTGLGFLFLMCAALLGAQTAVIQQISGTVEVKRPGSSQWEAAKAGQVLDQAALISTGFRSTALVRIGNSTIAVRALTRLSLEELAAAQSGEQVTVNLRAGRIRADVKPPAGGRTNFTVRSPTATASVRGTVFDFDGIRLNVAEGIVYLAGSNAAGVYIRGGHAAAANPETGRIPAAIEVVKEELSPAPPAGVEQAAALVVPVSVSTSNSSSSAGDPTGDLDIDFDWN